MNKGPQPKNVICFGEILWDMLPSATRPGGAPMNVAYHLNKLQVNAHLISRTGIDMAGEKLMMLLQEWGLRVDLCGTDVTYATSEVHARVGANHEVTYDILFPVAWDFIPYESRYSDMLRQADALVFGSLITRNETSRQTLYQLLEESAFNVFDVNLRAPHYSPEIIKHLLHHTHLLKLNEQELLLITDWFCGACETEADRIKMLQDQFGILEILVTKGSRGASFFTPYTQIDCTAFKVEVADTVGSGDAFLAAFLAKRLQNQSAEVALSYAAALGGFVTKNHGACPAYTLQDLELFKAANQAQFSSATTAGLQVV